MNTFVCHLITDSIDIMSILAVSTKMGYINWDFVFLTVIEMTYFLLVCNLYEFKYYHIFDTRYLVSESRTTIGQDGSGPEFHVHFGSGRVGSL